jgi:hypothetical protein
VEELFAGPTRTYLGMYMSVLGTCQPNLLCTGRYLAGPLPALRCASPPAFTVSFPVY